MQQILPEVLRTRLDIELQIRIDNNMIQRTNSTIFVGRRQLPRFVESATTQRPTCSYAKCISRVRNCWEVWYKSHRIQVMLSGIEKAESASSTQVHCLQLLVILTFFMQVFKPQIRNRSTNVKETE